MLFCKHHQVEQKSPGTGYFQFSSGATIPNPGGSQVADSDHPSDMGDSCEISLGEYAAPDQTGGDTYQNGVG